MAAIHPRRRVFAMVWAAFDVETAGIAGLAVLLGGAVKWVWDQAWTQFGNRREKLRKEKIEDEETGIKRLEGILNRTDRELSEVKTEVRELREKYVKSEIAFAKAVTWIIQLESILEQNGIKHKKWVNGHVEEMSDDRDHPQ